MKRERKNYSRGEREVMVITALAVHIQHGNDNRITAYKLARLIGMTPCPRFYDILRQMVVDGKLDTFSRPNRGKWTTWFYELPKGSYTPPKKSHTVSVKVKGRQVDQLELWT